MYKCPICNDKFNEVEDLYGHLEKEHNDSIPKDQSAAQYYYFLKTGKEHGNCVICKMPTKWNDSTGKYARFCENMECKEKYTEEFKKRMIGKYGRVHLLNDPDQQRKMLANRSISGEYEWSDNKTIPYTGSYEKDFLQFLDVFMHFDSEDIIAPSPHTYYYIYEGEEKFYIPDVFIASLNLEIEIKDGGDNPNNHHKIQAVDKVKEKLKDDVMTSQKEFSYIKIVNKSYDTFFDFMMRKKKEFSDTGSMDEALFILTESAQPETANTDLDLLIEAFISELNQMDKEIGYPAVYNESEIAMEAFYGDDNKAINNAYNYSDRYQFGFLFKNFDLIISNMFKRAQQTGNFEGIRDNLLEMADRCKSVSEVNFLRRDLSAGKIMLARLAKNRPDISKQCLSQIKWIDEVYRPALAEKAKQLKSVSVKESMGDISLTEIENKRKYGSYEGPKKEDMQFNRQDVLLNHYKQIAHPNATQDELKYVLEIMEAEYNGMMNNTTGINVALANGITELKKEVQSRIVNKSFPQ